MRAGWETAWSFPRSSAAVMIPVAPCRFEDINEELSVLVMDRVTPVIGAFSDKSMPWWVSFVDCGQVGHLPNGELVAYDL
jgi:hypothetical protein